MNGPFLYQTAEFQRCLLANGTREDLIEWLVWNDPNGTYTDEDSAAEGLAALARERAAEIMRDQLAR